MTRRSLSLLLLVLPLWIGCGKKEPLVPVDQFPKALIGLEIKTEEVFAAFDAGYPKAADGAIHNILRDFKLVERLAEPAGLNADQQAELSRATENLLEAYHELHAPMHKTVFPEDFDFEPIRERMTEGLAAIRAALPEPLVAVLQAAKEARTVTKPLVTVPTKENVEAANEEASAAPVDAGAAVAVPAFRVAAASSADPIAPLCPSVMLWDDKSFELAPERVNRVAELMAGAPPGRRWVQLVPTLQARLNADLTIDAYGTMPDRGGSWTSAENFAPATDRLANRFRDAFAAAIGQAVRRGLNVSILPHLDPAGGPTNEWRNLYDFAPGDKIGAGSYESLLIEPLAAAIEAEATSDTRIDLALSGEMGRSLFEHPAEYLALLKRLRERFASNHRTAGVRIGVALDWGVLKGEGEVYDKGAAAAFFRACDFVGVSCYSPVSEEPLASDFSKATRRFVKQLSTLTGSSAIESKRLIYSEVGIGGGYPGMDFGDSGDDSWATADDYPTPSAVAAAPHEGRGNPRLNPWEAGELIWLRREFHKALCDYLATSGEVEKAFLWSEGPWDPQGIADKRFRDDRTTKLIDKHNRRAP